MAITSLLLSLSLLLHSVNSLRTEENRIYIESVSDFTTFAKGVSETNTYYGTTILLDTDLDLSSYTGSIGNDKKSFDGVLDGQGHVIDNLVPGSTKYIGLFGRSLKGLTIRNLIMGENCLFKPQDIMNEPFTSVLVGKCNAVYSDCKVENVVTLSTIRCTKAFVRHSYLGAAFGGCEADSTHICHVRNMVNYGILDYNSASSNELYLGGIMSYCKGSSATVTPGCIIENTVNYGSVIYKGSLATVTYVGGFLSFCSKRILVTNVAQFDDVYTKDRLDSDYRTGYLIGDSDGGSSTDEKNVLTRAFWKNGIRTNRERPIDVASNTDQSKYVGSFDPNSFALDSAVNATSSRLVDFLNEYVDQQNILLKKEYLSNCKNSGKTTKRSHVLRDENTNSLSETVNSNSVISNSVVSNSASSENDDDGDENACGEPFRQLYSWVQVSFDSHGGSQVPPRAFIKIPYYNTLVYKVDYPTKSDVTFVGWYMDSQFNTPFDPSLLTVGRTHTLHAKWSAYKITFDSNGGSDCTSLNAMYEYNTLFTLPSEALPTREGYSFYAWVPQDTVTKYNETFYYTPNHDVTFKAVWSEQSSTVRLYSQYISETNNTVFREYKLTFNTVVRFPKDIPEKEGYTFVEWRSIDGLEKKGSDYYVPLRDIAFEAVWTPKHYSVFCYICDDYSTLYYTANYLSGEEVEPVSTTPARTGYTFISWEYANYTFESDPNSGKTVMPSHDIYIFGKWEIAIFSVSFYDNTSVFIESVLVKYNETIPYPKESAGDYTLYWILESSPMTSLTKTIGPVRMPGYNISVYALWMQTKYYFTMMTNPLRNESVTIEVHKGDPLPTLSDSLKYDGYTFTGWNTKSSCDGDTFSQTVVEESDVIAYSCWEANLYDILTFANYDENNNINNTFNIKCGHTFEISEFERTGYIFVGWCEDSKCSNGLFTDTVMPPRNLVLYASWTQAAYSCCINYNYKNSNNIKNEKNNCKSIYFNTVVFSAFAIPRSPEFEGHTFVGWSTKNTVSNISTDSINIETFRMPSNNVTLYAIWDPISYYLFFDPGKKVNSSGILKEYLYGATIEFPEYVRGNFTNGGWYTDDSFDDVYLFNSTTMPARNTILFVKWVGDPYKVTFKTNKGKKMDPVTIEYNSDVNFNTEYAPERKNFVFGGWFLDKKFETKCLYKKMPAQDLNLYARWKSDASAPALSLLSIILLALLVTF